VGRGIVGCAVSAARNFFLPFSSARACAAGFGFGVGRGETEDAH